MRRVGNDAAQPYRHDKVLCCLGLVGLMVAATVPQPKGDVISLSRNVDEQTTQSCHVDAPPVTLPRQRALDQDTARPIYLNPHVVLSKFTHACGR